MILTAWSAAGHWKLVCYQIATFLTIKIYLFIGVVGGVVFTLVFNHFDDPGKSSDPYPYNVNSWWLLGVVVVGWSSILFVAPTPRDERVWRWITFRKRVIR